MNTFCHSECNEESITNTIQILHYVQDDERYVFILMEKIKVGFLHGSYSGRGYFCFKI